MCLDNADYLASLEAGKIYRVLVDEKAQARGMIRILDESGEDYLYSERRFIRVALSKPLKAALTLAG